MIILLRYSQTRNMNLKHAYPLQEVGLGLVGVVDAMWWLPDGLTGIWREEVVEGCAGVGEWPTSEPPPDEPENCPVVLLAFAGTVTGIEGNPWIPYRKVKSLDFIVRTKQGFKLKIT